MAQPEDTVAHDVLGAAGEYFEGVIPDEFARRLRGSDSAEGLLGVLFDAYTAIPEIAGPFIHFFAQRLKGQGGMKGAFGEVLETIPATSRMLRLLTNKSPASARADLVTHWRRFRNNRSIGAMMANPATGAPPAAATPPAPLPPPVSSKIQVALNESGYSPEQRNAVLYLFRIFRTEGKVGSDIVAELEGDARTGKAGIVQTVAHNANDLLPLLEGPEFVAAMDAYDEMRRLEMTGGVTDENREAWKTAAAQFVRCLMPAIEFILMGYAELHPDSASASAALDLADNLNLFAGLNPSSTFQRARKVQRAVVLTARGFGLVFAALLLYMLYVVNLAATDPASLVDFAYQSTWWMVIGCAVVIIAGGIFSGVAQIVGVLALFYLVPIALTVAWTVAGVFTPQVDWRAFWFPLLVVIILDFVSFGLLQKAVNAVGAIPAFLFSFMRDKDQAKAVSEKLVKFNFIAGISSTVAGAIVLLWLPLFASYVADVPVEWRVGLMALIVVAACTYGYLKRSATMKNYATYAGELGKEIQDHDKQNLNLGYAFLRLAGVSVLVLCILVGAFGAARVERAKDATVSLTGRSIGVLGDLADRALDAAEGVVRKDSVPAASAPAATSQQRQVSESRESGGAKTCHGRTMAAARARLEALNSATGGDYCNGGQMTSYPCGCGL